jgi:hypothetical protein
VTPENIEAVYGADHCVYSHPVNGLPVVLVNGGGRLNNSKAKEAAI